MPARPGRSDSTYARWGKRGLDLTAGLAILLVFGLGMLIIALLIRLEDGGPVFYRQERIGRDGHAFRLTKFRSMVCGAEHQGAGIRVERNDSRITRIGRILRKLSLDELAQVFDVLRGDMSLVGPRPGLRYQTELYDAEQMGRLAVRPGITGWAQINGRNSIAWPQRIRLDLAYIDQLSLGMDIRILVRTIPAILAGSDQIADADYWKQRRAQVEAHTPEPSPSQAPDGHA
jgi:lipopolysaccharide/colanic/teichoic acid biosynthesis glycosyltransferase